MADALLTVEGLTTEFATAKGRLRAVDGVSFSLEAGETLAIVGESGSGKSVTAMSLMRLLPEPPASVAAERLAFDGRDLMGLTEPEWKSVRGRDIAMIFQDPMSSLHPILKIGKQLSETLETHTSLSATERRARCIELMRLVRIPEPEQRLNEYPHNLSGGMRQRVMIAMALACNPRLLIADEPTTALDVTIQAQILALMGELQERLGMATILITHDMGVVAETAHRVLVMYAGRVVEEATVEELFRAPQHPYTAGLMNSIPRIDTDIAPGERSDLAEIPGVVPALSDLPPGCAFAARCGFATDRCVAERPPLAPKAPGHAAACWHSDQLAKVAA